MKMKKDIRNRKDIELFVNTFYDTIKTDSVIGFLFTEIANVNWDEHLPRMYDFWENILFCTGNYSGSPMQVHKDLNSKYPMKPEHFDHWMLLFTNTIDALFEGERAIEIKERALNIANVIMYKTLS